MREDGNSSRQFTCILGPSVRYRPLDANQPEVQDTSLNKSALIAKFRVSKSGHGMCIGLGDWLHDN